MLNIEPGNEKEFFEWLVEQRLKALFVTSGLPREGIFIQESTDYEDIEFVNEHQYANLVIETEKQYPEFDFYKVAQKQISFADLEVYRRNRS